MSFVIFLVNFKSSIFWFGLLIAAELAVAAFYILPVLTYGPIGFPLDDSWIYAVFARNFASSGEIAFNLGNPSVGFTSSLWFLFLSLGQLLGFSPVAWSIFLGCSAQVILAVVTGFLVYRFLIMVGERTVGEVSNLDPGEDKQSGLETPPTRMEQSGLETPPARLGKSGLETPPTRLGKSGLETNPAGTARLLSFLASLLILFCGPLIWYSLSGMETTCFLAIGLLAILFLSRGWYKFAGISLGLLLITRIEGIALWGIAVAYAVVIESRAAKKNPFSKSEQKSLKSMSLRGVRNERRSNLFKFKRRLLRRDAPRNDKNTFRYYLIKIIKKLLPLLIIPSIFLILELLKNLYLTGALLPTTFAGRKWLSVPAGGRGPIAYLRLWGYGFKLTLLPQFLQEKLVLMFFWIGAGMLSLFSIRLILKEAIVRKDRMSGLGLFLLWVIGHNLVYMVMLPSPSQAGRYQALNYILFWVMLFLPVAVGLSRLVGKFTVRNKIYGAVLSVFLAIIFFLDLGSAIKWKNIYLATVRHINDVHIQVAGWLEQEIPPGSRVAAFDIGALKYFSPRTEIIDLGGLVDREFAGYLQEGRVVDYMKDRKVSYLAMVELQNSPGWIFENLKIQGDPRLKLKPLFGMMQRPEIYYLHYREAAITFPKMVVYEIEWAVGSRQW